MAGGAPELSARVEECMGTVISVAVPRDRATGAHRAALDAAFAELHRADAVFSTYRRDSDVCRLRRGETDLAGCAPEVAEVVAIAEELRVRSGGSFDAAARGPELLDLNGVVKGWAAERASRVLTARGLPDHCVNAGGDVRLAGAPTPARPWRTGVADPHDPGRLVAVVEGRDLAVATSGAYERGDHVLDARSGLPARGLASVTVVGPDLTWADAYATAAFAMGPDALDWLTALDGHEALTVTPDGVLHATPGFSRFLPAA